MMSIDDIDSDALCADPKAVVFCQTSRCAYWELVTLATRGMNPVFILGASSNGWLLGHADRTQGAVAVEHAMYTYTCLIFGVQRTCLHAEAIAADEDDIHDAAEHILLDWPDAVGYEVWLHGRKILSHFHASFDDGFARRVVEPSSSLALTPRSLHDGSFFGKR